MLNASKIFFNGEESIQLYDRSDFRTTLQRQSSMISAMTVSTNNSISSLKEQEVPPGIVPLNESITSFSESLVFDFSERQPQPQATTFSSQEPSALLLTPPSLEEKETEMEIEITPGVYLPFRNSQDTWKAIQRGHGVGLQCWECHLTVICPTDCEYVICPDQSCHAINPNGATTDGTTAAEQQQQQEEDKFKFGILMGFRKEWCGQYYQEEDETAGCSNQVAWQIHKANGEQERT